MAHTHLTCSSSSASLSPPPRAMSKHAKKPTKGNRSITEFFTSRPSTGTPSSQPASSQPSSSQPTLSQKASSKMALRQPSKKGNVPATLQKQPILVSSDSEPVPASSKNNRPHTSLSDSSDSVVLVPSGPSKAKPPATTKATSKTKKPVGSSRVVQSSAKTTVKRRVQPAAAGATSAKPVFRKKRKVDWDSNSDDEAFTLDPSKMNPALTRAPVPRTIPFSPKAKGKERAVETVPSSPSTRSTSSKRRRITPPEGIPAPSSDDADIEEVPSSISAEEDLVLPKHLTKNPRVVQKKAARWQREASVMSSMSELTPPPSEYPSSSPLSGPSPALKPQLAVMEDVEAVMDVDMTEAADALLGEDGRASGESEAEVSQELHPRSSFSVDNQPRSNMLPSLATPEEDYVPTDLRPTTPPPIETLPPLPPTPVALDTEAKTKLILKQIQARAEAAAKAAQNTSDEEIELRELSSDDDDDLVLRVPSTRRVSSLQSHSNESNIVCQIGQKQVPNRVLPAIPAVVPQVLLHNQKLVLPQPVVLHGINSAVGPRRRARAAGHSLRVASPTVLNQRFLRKLARILLTSSCGRRRSMTRKEKASKVSALRRLLLRTGIYWRGIRAR